MAFLQIRIHIIKVLFCNSLKFVLFVAIAFPLALAAQTTTIIPLPKSFAKTDGTFQINGNTIVGMNSDSLLPLANYLQTELQKTNGLLIAVDPNEVKALIDLQLVKDDKVSGAYSLKIEPNKITIISSGREGVFYGIISLLQMIKKLPDHSLNLPTCEITDAPRYQWRGFMLDESRHFFGKQKVKQLLNWMAYYKLNRLHWHLTDVDAWRIEIKKYPKLTQIGSIGNHTDSLAEAKFYTQDDIKEIVTYAQQRFVTIIPEIDMPGHATAANRAYPEYSGGSVTKYPNFTFDPANEKTYQFLADILKETNALFPSQMMHLGGDEVAFGIQAWAGRPAITEMMAKNKFTSLSDLEHYFFRRMADTVLSLNSKLLCWDEAVETDLPADKTIIFWWRQNFPSSLKLALQKNYQVVLCPRLPLYFDFVQDKDNVSGRKWSNTYFNSVSDVYNFPDKQMPADQLQSNLIIGIQANLWTETVGSEKRLDYMIFPRLAALSEAAWTDSAAKDERSFNERLRSDLPLYDKDGIYYYNPYSRLLHPEAIDFAPGIIKSPVRFKHHHHGYRSARHSRFKENRDIQHAPKHRIKIKKKKKNNKLL
jgi:hexosaminidase